MNERTMNVVGEVTIITVVIAFFIIFGLIVFG